MLASPLPSQAQRSRPPLHRDRDAPARGSGLIPGVAIATEGFLGLVPARFMAKELNRIAPIQHHYHLSLRDFRARVPPFFFLRAF